MNRPDQWPYVEGGSLVVTGRVAAIWCLILAAPKYQRLLDQYRDVDERATREALRRAARQYKVMVEAEQRNRETADQRLAAVSRDELINTAEAARILGVTVRRAQQLAKGGMGELQAGQWRLWRTLVLT